MKNRITILFIGLVMFACNKDNSMEYDNDLQIETREAFIEKAKKDKVQLCHMGRTLYVPAKTVSLHLEHGDYLGECAPCETGILELDQMCEILENILISNPPSFNYRCFRSYENSWVRYNISEPEGRFSVGGLKTETGYLNMFYASNIDDPINFTVSPGEYGYLEAERLFNNIRAKVISVNGYDCSSDVSCQLEPWSYTPEYEFFNLCDFLENVILDRFICYSRTTTYGSLSDIILIGQYNSMDMKVQLYEYHDQISDHDAGFVLDADGLSYVSLTYIKESIEHQYIVDMMNYIRHLAWTMQWTNTYDNCSEPWVISCCEGIQ